MNRRFYFNIDVLGSCNLRCPSCPQGNSRDVPVPTGFMEPDLLRRIMEKATRECDVSGVGLFNWTEPLLHPKLPELVDIVQAHGVPCALSSNLNHMRDIDALLARNPASFRISTSGFTQPVYSATHAGGDIEVVKANMRELAEAKRRTGSTTGIHVFYHRYLGNLDDEVLMKAFAEDLGFEFQAVWAFVMPLEKVLAFIEHERTGGPVAESTPKPRKKRRLDVIDERRNGHEARPAPALTTDDVRIAERLALPISEALRVSRRYTSRPCALRDSQMTIDFEGNTQLCCGVFDSTKYTLSPFLDMSHEELQARKYTHDACSGCMDNGVHVYFTYGAPEFEALAKANIARRYAALGLDFAESPDVVNVKQLVSTVRSKAQVVRRRVARVRDRLRTFVA